MIILVHVQGLINILITILTKIHTFSFDPCSNQTTYESWNYFIYYKFDIIFSFFICLYIIFISFSKSN